ncbi:copper amine oxidase [Paenibacillus melissococcoides]|uniref:Copper amine oxidase n=1 Tax=Paenibacillus melissococcoides TaxID=2912268 RepID=A0ABN8U794_9BACL|nr:MULTISPECIES: copper amine oxidase [Paenibacillus]GIO81931.1 hypothetical protein J6TS7_55410 [Paenibacillus dendritiformis]CAH8246847.1 copper amine oxidase [Paenibacillus melissococcoides]CAH8715936.1 copper amine oxidase [Paenibacillus melissococcoides]CAH8716890.1 copper amine oxidase [Paenibacillus melissococcoides]
MKKWTYLLTGVVIGAIVATAGSAYAEQIKSLVGKKVTGEYTVIVDGKTLADKGAVIEGRTNAPVRGLADALGVDMKVEGKKIIITSDDTDSASNTTPTNTNNPYLGRSKADLEKSRDSIQNDILASTEEGRRNILAKIQELEKNGAPRGEGTSLTAKEEQLASYDAEIAKYTKELELINEALAALEK